MSDALRESDQHDRRLGGRLTLACVYDTRRNNFDCFRFVLASLVIWSHCFPLSGRKMDWFYALSGQIDGGSLAVDGFFILSGFLVTQSWLSCPNVMVFARKRFLRIVPAMVAALAFGSLIIAPFNTRVTVRSYFLSGEPWSHFLGVVFNHFLYLPTVFVTNPVPQLVNSPLWSLRYEILCYAGVVLLGLNRSRSWARSVVAVFVLSSIYYFVSKSILHDSIWSIPQMIARLVACFSAGMLFYVFRQRIPYRPALAGTAALVLLLTFFTAGFLNVIPLAGGYLLLYAAVSPRLRLSRFGRHGDFSYGLYVFAYPLQQTIVHVFGPRIPLPLFFSLSFGAALVLAFVSWHMVEAPALALKPRQPSAAPAASSVVHPTVDLAHVPKARFAGRNSAPAGN